MLPVGTARELCARFGAAGRLGPGTGVAGGLARVGAGVFVLRACLERLPPHAVQTGPAS